METTYKTLRQEAQKDLATLRRQAAELGVTLEDN